MPKQKLKALLPHPEELKKHKFLKVFAPFWDDPRLWHMNRGSLERAVYVGVFAAFLPLPFQMVLALVGALVVRANVPMSIALTWLTNPLTTIPAFWGAYWVGAKLLGEPVIGFRTIGVLLTDMSLWLFGKGGNPFLTHHFFSFKAFALGLLVCAIVTSVVLGFGFRLFWRYRIAKDWKNRQGYQSHIPSFGKQKSDKRNQSQK